MQFALHFKFWINFKSFLKIEYSSIYESLLGSLISIYSLVKDSHLIIRLKLISFIISLSLILILFKSLKSSRIWSIFSLLFILSIKLGGFLILLLILFFLSFNENNIDFILFIWISYFNWISFFNSLIIGLIESLFRLISSFFSCILLFLYLIYFCFLLNFDIL